MATLCVNIDHIATLRQARRGVEPDPVLAVGIVEDAGSTGITVHLREDRRHIQDRDVELIRQVVRGHLNLEMASTREIVDRAIELMPDISTLVPEKREEVTTEGGLDVVGQYQQVSEATTRLKDAGISVSLFIDPVPAQIEAAVRCGATEVEFHTGTYCNARTAIERQKQLETLIEACELARSVGLIVNAGHGLNYHNVLPVAAIEGMRELNIGHSIMSRAIFIGLAPAVTEMARLVELATTAPERFRSRP
ncbi:pyridoxine 5'-phosphate synthase [bacterium]|nr:pyridoxine 5'-phosphate synthase [bacterium]